MKQRENLLREVLTIEINSTDRGLVESYADIDANRQGKFESKPHQDSSRNILKNEFCPRMVFFTNLPKVLDMFRIMRHKTPFINAKQIIFCRRITVIFRNIGQSPFA
jgi:hypothetical protein